MRTVMLTLDGLEDDQRAELEHIALVLREPDDWNAGTRGLWQLSFEAFDSLRRFVNQLADCSCVQWEQSGGIVLLATFESGDGANLMDDGLNISVALMRSDVQRTFSPLLTVFVSDLAVFLGEAPTAESTATAICDALNQTLAHFAAN